MPGVYYHVRTSLSLSKAVDVFFPQPCLLCGSSLLLNRAPAPWAGLPICPECLRRLRPIDGARCRICSQPLVPGIELCLRCRTSRYPFAAQFSVFAYGGEMRELIGQYKFQGQRSLARLFAFYLAGALRQRFGRLPVVPVPSRPRAVRRRGWDHVGLIARQLAASYGIEILRLLARSNGRSQKTLDFEHRLTNLNGKIRWAPRASRLRAIAGKVVLLDDVFTTGATASECARILLEHGVGEVHVLTLAVD